MITPSQRLRDALNAFEAETRRLRDAELDLYGERLVGAGADARCWWSYISDHADLDYDATEALGASSTVVALDGVEVYFLHNSWH